MSASEHKVHHRRHILRQLKDSVISVFQANALQFIPIKHALPGYNLRRGRQDFKAAINVALLAFPQAMAYSLIAGLPVQYGIYTAAMASILGPIFTGSRFVALGPTNATSVMVMSTFLGMSAVSNPLSLMPTLLVLVAFFLIGGALIGVAQLIQYISRSVVTGYITAAAILIITNQADSVLGFSVSGASSFIGVLKLTWQGLPQTDFPTLAISGITALAYILLAWKKPSLPNVAIALLVASLAAEVFAHYGLVIDRLPKVPVGVFPLSFPSIEFGMMGQLAPGALAIAFLGVLEGSSIGKSLAARAGGRVNGNQEMLGMGVANLASSFVSGMPASGSLTRSVLNYTSGARTPFSHVYAGLICLVGVLTLGPAIGYVPKASLAVVVIGVGLSLIHGKQIRIVTKSTGMDATVFLITLISGLLLRLDFAIYLGTGTSIVMFLRKASTPELVEYTFNDEGNLTELTGKEHRADEHISIVHVEGELFFGAADLFRDQIRILSEDPALKIIILKMRNAYRLDATTMMALEELIRYSDERNRTLIVSGARRDVYRVFRDSGVLHQVGRENFFMDHPSNPNLSTAKALKRAQQILGKKTAEIRIYVDPNKPAK